MPHPEIMTLIERLDQARGRIRDLLPQVDPAKQIYPGWTLHHFLAHMTGWDDAVVESLRAHVEDREPETPAARGIDAYNAETIETRETIDLDKIIREWEQTREDLKQVLLTMPDAKFRQTLVSPWGQRLTVTQLVNVFIHHEAEEHAIHLTEWLQNPDQPLLDKH